MGGHDHQVCYVLTLNEGVSTLKIETEIQQTVDKHNPSEDGQQTEFYILQALSDIHFDDRFNSFHGSYIMSKKLIFIFVSVGLFILLIAFINFTNLSVVQTIKRAKEVGIRKVIGANRVT